MTSQLTSGRVIVLALAAAVVTANAYYIHPIIGPVADSFAISDGMVGIVPAANQIALALGVLLLLPLGDRFSNRRLVMFFLSVQVLALIGMALFDRFLPFVAASTLLGFFTITPYLLPAYVSQRVAPEQLGFATAILTAGVVAGVQIARVGSGVLAEWFGWRSVYWIAAGLMLASAVLLPMIMEREEPAKVEQPHYGKLLASMLQMAREHRDVVASGVIQALNFGIFIAIWMGIGLHLTSDKLNLGTDVVGYLSAVSLISLLTTPRLGKWADRLGPERARLAMALLQFTGIAALALVHWSWWWLVLSITVTSFAGPLVDVTGRMIGLRKSPTIRTRLMSIYVTLMFIGGSIGSWSGTLAYDVAGWNGTLGWSLLLSLLLCGLSWQQARRLP